MFHLHYPYTWFMQQNDEDHAEASTLYRYTLPCIQQYSTLYICSNTVPCIQQYSTLYTAIQYPVYSSTVPCIQQYSTLYTAIQYPVYSNTVPCIQQYSTLYTAINLISTKVINYISTIAIIITNYKFIVKWLQKVLRLTEISCLW